MLAAHDHVVLQWLAFATEAMVQDGWRLYPYVLSKLRTAICAMCMLVAVVTSAVDREAVDATWPVDRSENGDLRVCTV